MENKELEDSITTYVYQRFGNHITGNKIKYGNAMFTVDMLVRESIKVFKMNPDKEINYVVDEMFDYFCT